MSTEPLGEFAREVAERLSLAPHPEGGWYRETHRAAGSPRGSMTAILYLLDAGMVARWHRIDASEAWCWHAGGTLDLEIFEPGAERRRVRLGPGTARDVARAEPGSGFQAVVPPYAWQRASAGPHWVLAGCVVAPAFNFGGFELAPEGWSPEQADPRFDPLLAKAIADLNAESGSIHLTLDDGLLHLICSRGIPAPVQSLVRHVPVGKGMAGLAVERRGPVTACNIQTDTSGDVRPGAKATGLEGAIVVPIFDDHDGVVGALGVANRAARTFTPQETVRLIDHGRAIARARLGIKAQG
ncbi:MAG: cupin domain-containing protein [Phycisphaeraceae bacterium]|nr:cupin domain-containing protein [Phycisphaeraceae bacterium]